MKREVQVGLKMTDEFSRFEKIEEITGQKDGPHHSAPTDS